MVVRRNSHLLSVFLLGMIGGFILLTTLVLLDPIPKIDRAFSEEIQEHSNLFLDHMMLGISWVGNMPNSVVVIFVASLAFLIYRHQREALFVLLTAGAALLSTLVKMLVNRPRPLSTMVRIIEVTHQQSFPSGHVLFYTVFFGFIAYVMFVFEDILAFLRYSIIIFSLAMILLIPISRIYLGAHWFTDVTAGFCLGALYLYGLLHLYLRSNATKT